jgi:hypothetical protein
MAEISMIGHACGGKRVNILKLKGMASMALRIGNLADQMRCWRCIGRHKSSPQKRY